MEEESWIGLIKLVIIFAFILILHLQCNDYLLEDQRLNNKPAVQFVDDYVIIDLSQIDLERAQVDSLVLYLEK